jgi:hypothetical protein
MVLQTYGLAKEVVFHLADCGLNQKIAVSQIADKSDNDLKEPAAGKD